MKEQINLFISKLPGYKNSQNTIKSLKKKNLKLKGKIKNLREKKIRGPLLVDKLNKKKIIPESFSTFEIYKILYKKKAVKPQEIYLWLDSIFYNKDLRQIENLLDTPIEGLEKIWLYMRIKVLKYKGLIVDNYYQLIEEALNEEKATFLNRELINLLCFNCIIDKESSNLYSFLQNYDFLTISTRSLIGIIRKLIKLEDYTTVKDILKKLPINKRLNLILFEFRFAFRNDLNLKSLPANSFELIKEFQDFLDEKKNEESNKIQKYLINPLIKLSKDSEYMDIRIRKEEMKLIKNHIKNAIIKQEPFSFIRLGDGECYAFNYESISSKFDSNLIEKFKIDNLNREQSWWGSNKLKNRNYLKNGVIKAINQSDIIGIPAIYRIIRDICVIKDFPDIFEHRSSRGLINLYHGLSSEVTNLNGKYLTEERSHQLIYKEEFLKEIINLAKETYIITSWEESNIKESFLSDFSNINLIKIAGHTKVKKDWNQLPLSQNYDYVLEEIKEKCSKGSLFLIGAGLIGKIFALKVKEQGGIALDVGAMIDYWFSRYTRSCIDIV